MSIHAHKTVTWQKTLRGSFQNFQPAPTSSSFTSLLPPPPPSPLWAPSQQYWVVLPLLQHCLHMLVLKFHMMCRVVSRFLSSRFHPKSRQLFSFYFSKIMLRTVLHVLTFQVTGAVFKIASEMRRLPAYFDNPAVCFMNDSIASIRMS